MKRAQTARERIEAEKQRLLMEIDKLGHQADVLRAQLAGIEVALSALGPPLKRQVKAAAGAAPASRKRAPDTPSLAV